MSRQHSFLPKQSGTADAVPPASAHGRDDTLQHGEDGREAAPLLADEEADTREEELARELAGSFGFPSRPDEEDSPRGHGDAEAADPASVSVKEPDGGFAQADGKGLAPEHEHGHGHMNTHHHGEKHDFPLLSQEEQRGRKRSRDKARRHAYGGEHGHADDHGRHHHAHGDGHHHHDHGEHAHSHEYSLFRRKRGKILTVRAMSGLSGDMILCGLARMAEATDADLAELAAALRLPAETKVVLVPRDVQGISGWGATVTIPHEHSHRSFAQIKGIIEASGLDAAARELSVQAFARLAEAEGRVHGKPAADVTFHEVGALDSILDICLSCALFARLAPDVFVCSPLPLADGSVHCAHGWIPTPAPAVLDMLDGVPVVGFSGQGETITPTAITLLKALGADFGPWPAMRIAERALVYGGKVFPGAPNGSIWAFGESL